MKRRDRYTGELYVMFTVSVFQPVEKAIVVEKLKSYFGADEIDSMLGDLVKRSKLILESEHYRLSRNGENSIIPNKGRLLRDNLRMHYLASGSLQGGGA